MGKMTAFHPATLCWGFGRCLLRADTKPFPAALVRTLSRPFPPFGQRSLSALLSYSASSGGTSLQGGRAGLPASPEESPFPAR